MRPRACCVLMRYVSQHSGYSFMNSIPILTAFAFAVLSTSAFAGPNSDAINGARRSAQPRKVATSGEPGEQAMSDHRAIMMAQMPMGGRESMHEQLPQRSSGQPGSAGAALFGALAAASSASRAVTVLSGMNAVSVQSGETVRFDFGTASATWTFAPRTGNTAVDLGTLFPDIPAAKGVWAHLNGSKLYQGH
ncbi:heavy-metal resistance protein CzcE [Cupriavidus metallidurans]